MKKSVAFVVTLSFLATTSIAFAAGGGSGGGGAGGA
jgi:hypothetical protein